MTDENIKEAKETKETEETKETKETEETKETVTIETPETPATVEVDVLEEALSETPPPDYKAKLVGLEELKPGMTVRVHEKIKDISPKGEERERVQVFEGIILALRGAGSSRTMTVRKVSKGFGVEKIYPINSPVIDKIELVKTAKVRRAKLWYLGNIKKRFKRKLRETWAK